MLPSRSDSLLCALALLALSSPTETQAQAIWNQTGDLIDLPWDENANWDTGTFPNAPGAAANFTDPNRYAAEGS